ncbi:MAG: hypothetical protein ACI87E_002694 [Mariniblastus sp.]|jgi:hypothetical protein
MTDFFNELINPVNLPVTALLVLVLLYWLMVIVGVLGLDSFDFDFDAPDAGIDADFGLDAGVNGDFGIDAQGGIDTSPATSFGGGSSTSGNDGLLRTAFDFFYLGEVPIVIIGTFFVLFLWIATYLTNHYWNTDQSVLVMLMWSVPNTFVSLLVTRYTMIPFAKMFRLSLENTTRDEMVGLIGRVTTSEVTEKFGQLELRINNEPEMKINVRTRPGKQLAKGDAAKIISFNNTDGTFLVALTKWENQAND